MPGFTLTVALIAAAAIAIRKCFSGDKDDGHSPPRDSYHSSSSYNSGTWSQTQQSYRPPPQPYRPPPPRYSYYTPETNAQSKTTTRSPAPPDYSRDVYRESVASTRTLRQTQPSTRTQASSRVPSCVPTERDPLLPPVIRSVSRSNVPSPYTRTFGQTQLPTTRTQPSSTLVEPSSTHSSITQSASANSRLPTSVPIQRDSLPRTVVNGVYHTSAVSPYTRTPSQTQQPSIVVLPSSSRSQLSSTVLQLSSTATQPSSSNIQSSSTLTQASHQRLSLINKAHVHEPPEYKISQARSQVPACVHTRNEPSPPTVNQAIVSEVRSGEPASVEDLDFAEKLRVQARHRSRDMVEARSRAKNAQKKGYKGAAQEHRQEVIAHEKVMKELNKRAAKIIFREKNKVSRYLGIRRD